MKKNIHKSVLLKEAVDALKIRPGAKYIDATFGGGGHAREILERKGVVLGIDADGDAISLARNSFEKEIKDSRLFLAQGNFKNIKEIAQEYGFQRVSGIILDLGLSSNQLEEPDRGFSYLRQGPLDMRMDKNLGVSAADLINALGEKELYEIFIKYGEEARSRTISSGIVGTRGVRKIETTQDLVDVIAKILKIKGDSDFMKSKIAQKIFQALRIAVNDEIGALKEVLDSCPSLLESRARLAVISFHSLEDRIVKQAFKKFEKDNLGQVFTKKPFLPSVLEISANPRAKSAKMRVFEKI